jgi:cell division GTPase FtsZ
MGKDLRFLLVAVGGGAIQVAKTVANRHVKYLETAAINCDRKVMDEKVFDKNIYLGHWMGEEVPDSGGSPSMGSALAHVAEEEIEDLFEGATCVTVLASLGGGSGTGVLPVLLDTLTRSPDLAHLTVILIKPFACEERRRHLAERAMAGLYFIDGLTELVQSKRAAFIILDNEDLARDKKAMPISHLVSLYADEVTKHVEKYISLSEMEATLSCMRDGEMLGAPSLRVPGEDAGMALGTMGVPQGVAALLKTNQVAPPPPSGDVEFVFEAITTPTPPTRPRDPPPLPGP